MAPNSTSFDRRTADEVYEKVLRALCHVRNGKGFDPQALTASASLADLGADSLLFVEVAIALEDELGIVDFPLQAWADEQASRPEGAFTLTSLVDYAHRCMEARAR